MSNRAVKYILIASLSFNLAFVSLGIYKRFIEEKKGNVIETKKGSLSELSSDNRREVEKIIDKFNKKMVNYRSEILDKRIDIIQEMGNPEFTSESVKSKIQELNKIENEMNDVFIDTLVDISSAISQKNWLKFLYNLSRSWFFSGIETD